MLHKLHQPVLSSLVEKRSIFVVCCFLGMGLFSCKSLSVPEKHKYSVAMEYRVFGFDGKGGSGWNENTLFSDNPPYFAVDGLKTESVKLWIGGAMASPGPGKGQRTTMGQKPLELISTNSQLGKSSKFAGAPPLQKR